MIKGDKGGQIEGRERRQKVSERWQSNIVRGLDQVNQVRKIEYWNMIEIKREIYRERDVEKEKEREKEQQHCRGV